MVTGDVKVGASVTFTLYEHQPTLKVVAQGTVVGLPTSEALQGTVKVVVTKILSEGKIRKFYRDLIGKHLRVPLN